MRTLILALLAWSGLAAAAMAQDVVGVAVPLQADQITIEGARISLYGIDAPDPDMDRFCTASGRLYGCFTNAKRELEILIDEGPFACTGTGEFNYVGFPYMICTVNGKDVGEDLVRAGWALAFLPQTDKYVATQQEAEAEGVGLWQPGIFFQLPWEHRDDNNRPVFGP